jgi:uncharacterized membrane protein YcfT
MFIQEHGALGTLWLYLESFVEPFGTLWFIYLLPIFFVVTKLAHGRVPAWVIWLAAGALEIAPIATGWTVIDEFASRFVYFYTGYLLAPRIFAFAQQAQTFPEAALALLGAWSLVNGVLVFNGYAELPLVSLALGLAGAAAVVTLAALMATIDLLKPLRYCGQNSIVIYLAFFLPMAASRALLIKLGWISDVGTISALVTVTGVLGALMMFWVARAIHLTFLFERPARFWLAPKEPTKAKLAASPFAPAKAGAQS